jgi:hypothetical protein
MKKLTPAEQSRAEGLAASMHHQRDTYQQRQHLAAVSFSREVPEYLDLAYEQAAIERAQFKTKYKVREIKAAAALSLEYDRQHMREIIRDKVKDGAEISATGRLWFDKINGNTYHSVRLNVAGVGVYIPRQYGYGDQWKQSATDWLWDNGIIEKDYHDNGDPKYKDSYARVNWRGTIDSLKREL